MANKKTADAIKYPKDTIVNAKRFSDYTDYLTGNLEDKDYSIEEVQNIINKAYGKKGEE